MSSLFVANIPVTFSEEAFGALWLSFPGYEGARLREDRNGATVGFVDFEDEECSAHAIEVMNGKLLDDVPLIVQHTRKKGPRKPRRQQQYRQQQQQYAPSSSSPSFQGLPEDANNTLFVDGVPEDVTEREMAHIFRPFPGYQSVRLPQASNGKLLCFVVFGTPMQANIAKDSVQGYNMDLTDEGAGRSFLTIYFARKGNGGRRRGHEDSDSD